MRIYESPFVRDLDDPILNKTFGNMIYMVLMTIFTVGYGDIAPVTKMGRFWAFIAALWGSFLIALNVVAVTNFF
jgi:hypothetical protein